MRDAYFAFGKCDFVIIVETTDNVNAVAALLAFGAGGALKSTKTTPLLIATEAVEAMKKASGTGYKPATTFGSERTGPTMNLAPIMGCKR